MLGLSVPVSPVLVVQGLQLALLSAQGVLGAGLGGIALRAPNFLLQAAYVFEGACSALRALLGLAPLVSQADL
jgi:hypothetical protein